jgi:ubiquinone/menaquinone biosynthesis C-methylase UbiE
MSVFSDLDASPEPDRPLQYLDETDAFMSAFKAYVVAVMLRYVPGGRVLDVGCGVGHDLARLDRAGLTSVGVDMSHLALLRARSQSPAVVRGDAARLPFRDGSFAGLRVERVLQHVPDPRLVVDEMLRVVRPGGVLAVLDADQTSLRVESRLDPSGALLGGLSISRQPAVAAGVADLLRQRNCRVDDVVTELSFGYQLDGLPVDAASRLQRAVRSGALTADEASAWLAEQTARTEEGTFRASWTKILVVARTPGATAQMRRLRQPLVESASRAQCLLALTAQC